MGGKSVAGMVVVNNGGLSYKGETKAASNGVVGGVLEFSSAEKKTREGIT